MNQTDDELREWLRNLYPFLASDAQAARFVALVRERQADGMKLGFARIFAIKALADETWRKSGAEQAQEGV